MGFDIRCSVDGERLVVAFGRAAVTFAPFVTFGVDRHSVETAAQWFHDWRQQVPNTYVRPRVLQSPDLRRRAAGAVMDIRRAIVALEDLDVLELERNTTAFRARVAVATHLSGALEQLAGGGS